MSNTYVIADLHGRFDLLQAAFSAIHADANGAPNKIVTLGDYVDRGPQSCQVIEHLMAAQSAGMNLVCLMGNHEDMMWGAMKGQYNPHWWLGNGGYTTLDSYNHKVPQSHLNWISSLPKLHVDRHRVYVHAGVDPTRCLHEQSDEYLLWFRYMPGTDVGHGDRHVVHGHTPSSSNPEKLKNRTNLDTEAYATGRLVIAVFDDDIPGAATDYIEIR